MSSLITDDEQPDDVTSAESFLTRHEEHKAEIDTRQKSVNEFYEAADTLIADGHSASTDVKEKKQRLHKAWLALQDTWREKGDELEEAKEVQVFKRDADQLEAWLNARDLDQESGDFGDSLDAVEELLKKQEEFENMLLAQEMKLLGITKLTQQEQGINKQREEENELREEEERRQREEEEEMLEQELRERQRLEELRQKQEDERKEKERKQREEREKIRAQEEKKRAEAKAKQEEQKKRQEVERQRVMLEAERQRVMLEEQRRREEQNKARDIYDRNKNDVTFASSPEDQQKASSTVEGILQRKQDLESGGKKAHARAWKTLYTVLRGHQLFFYREKKDALSTKYAAPSIDLKDGFCEEASDVARRKNAFRVLCDDDSDFLFVAKDPTDLERWMRNISEVAGQTDPPSPPQAALLPSPKTSSRTPREESGRTTKLAKPYGRAPKPLITVTSFDDDEDVLIDPPPPPPVNIPPPSIPSDFYSDDLILEGDLDDKDNLVADSGSVPLEPDSPPAVPPPDFADFGDPSDGDDDLPVLPASPPPEFLSDDEDGLEDSSLAYVPTAIDHPIPPPRRNAKRTPLPVAPKPEGRLRSDSGESLDSVGKSAKPPLKPKPTYLAGQQSTDRRHAQGNEKLRSVVNSPESPHDDKRHEKKKGVLGSIFKKKK